MKWKKLGLLFQPDGSKDWSQTHAQVPVPYFLENKNLVRVFYSTRDKLGRSLPGFVDFNADTFQLVFESESPLLELGSLGEFDDSGVMPSWITRVGNQFYMYYIGWNERKTIPYHNSVGLAISSDCKNFNKYSNGPLWDRGVTEPHFSASSCVLFDKGVFKNWYLSCTGWFYINGIAEPRYHIKYAESHNGIIWKRDGKIAIDYKDIEEGGIVKASVIKDSENNYKMWYAYRKLNDYRQSSDCSYRIGYADSFDGVSWKRKDEKMSAFKVSIEGWDSFMLAYPHVIDIKGKRYLFYNGNQFGKTGFGVAVLE